MTKDQIGAASIERSFLGRGPDGQFRYFTSFVSLEDDRWCTAVIKAPRIEDLNPKELKKIFTGAALGVEGVKDPWVMMHDGTFYMFISVAVSTAKTNTNSHKTQDIYNTGECVSSSALATSKDMETWKYEGLVFTPAAYGWDHYCRRINSVLPLDGKFYAFYDGSGSHYENYEERTAVAVSTDLKSWTSLSPQNAFWTSPYASKSLRYVSVLPLRATGDSKEQRIAVAYEFARQDGSHDLRLVEVNSSQLQFPKQ
jgi:hypothetical protein